MRIGVLCLPTDEWPVWVERARRLDELGFHHLWTFDHLSWRHYAGRPWHSAIPLLTATAAATSRIRVGTLVASPNFRHPVPFGHELMTADRISAGRLILGIGGGGTGWDATALGQRPWPPPERTARFTEFVSTLDTLLTQPETSLRGTYYSAENVRIVPGCVQQPRIPFAIAAVGPKALRLTAKHGDAWITTGRGKTGDWRTDLADQWQIVEAECEKLGRDPAGIDKILVTSGIPGRVTADIDEFDDFVVELEAYGFTDVVFPYPRSDDDNYDDPPEIVEQIAEHFLR
ncbi:LLM class flavin-dependent oxidoreductase [Fodinicola acaciae]|uniref:LLM class flavin-dependent oxidoreductase n=1 Tax=Fodinicola acaciae TaxID=2681555 RepID=UPI0013D6C933|nr:LLM class flavin-dependent oxidoreductase [Fodinicola acaciae]